MPILIALATLVLSMTPAFAESPPQIEWLTRYTGTGIGNNQVTGMALDAQGCTYVTGYSSGAWWDIATVKYSPSGRQLWAVRYSGPHGGDDVPYGIALDGRGHVYVAGYSDGNGESNYDFLTLQYDTTLVQQWVRTYAGQNNIGLDEAYAVTADADGNAYVTGFSFEAATGDDWVTIKYDPSGNALWTRRFNGLGNSDDGANAIAADPDGNVYVTGSTQRSPSGGNYDFTTVKYDAAGNPQWAKIYNGPANGNDGGIAAAVDAARNVYVAGYSSGVGTLYNLTAIKYSPTGRQIWLRVYDANHGYDAAKALALGPDANLYVTGYATLGGGPQSDYATLAYDSTGTRLWLATYDGPVTGFDEGQAVALDGAGNVYVTGYSDGGSASVDYDYATVKYDPAGAQQWVTRYNGPGDNIDIGVGIALNAKADVIVSGWSTGTNPPDVDFTTIEYAQAGAAGVPEPVAWSGSGRLLEASPNPFGAATTLRLSLPEAGRVELKLYDVAGRRVETLLEDRLGAGIHALPLSGAALAPGVYLYRLDVGSRTESGKLIRRD